MVLACSMTKKFLFLEEPLRLTGGSLISRDKAVRAWTCRGRELVYPRYPLRTGKEAQHKGGGPIPVLDDLRLITVFHTFPLG